MSSFWCLQFSDRRNGGNQALAAFFKNLAKDGGPSVVLRNGPSSLVKICLYNRHAWVVVSDPICALVLFVFGFQKVIQFIQSDDYELFSERGRVFNLLYRTLYSALVKFTNWKRVFNSNYSRLKFNTRFGQSYEIDSVVPMLGLKDLFPTVSMESVRHEKVRRENFLWVGSQHWFKGGAIFARIIEKLGYQGKMLFAGDVPHWARKAADIEVMNNLDRSEIFRLMKKAECYVYTSCFDSFGLPIFEALHNGCPVVALENECLELNETSQFIHVVNTEKELEKALYERSYLHNQPKLVIDWDDERQRLLDWIDLNLECLQNG